MRATAPSVCPHDCPSQCALEVTVEAGRIPGVTGDPRHPFTRGVICGEVHDDAERIYGSTRVIGRAQRLFSNLKDAFGYFGIRAFLRGRGRAGSPRAPA